MSNFLKRHKALSKVKYTWSVPIFTKYLGATNTLGARVKASTTVPYWIEGDVKSSVTLGWDSAKTTSEMHDAAAIKLAEELDYLGGPNNPDQKWNRLTRADNGSDGFVYLVTSVPEHERDRIREEMQPRKLRDYKTWGGASTSAGHTPDIEKYLDEVRAFIAEQNEILLDFGKEDFKGFTKQDRLWAEAHLKDLTDEAAHYIKVHSDRDRDDPNCPKRKVSSIINECDRLRREVSDIHSKQLAWEDNLIQAFESVFFTEEVK